MDFHEERGPLRGPYPSFEACECANTVRVQIGKELLLPELPLRVRLIGLRVTKLKDLRANLDDKPGGIKRVRAPILFILGPRDFAPSFSTPQVDPLLRRRSEKSKGTPRKANNSAFPKTDMWKQCLGTTTIVMMMSTTHTMFRKTRTCPNPQPVTTQS